MITSIANLIPFLKARFPELELQILALEEDAFLKKDTEFEQFVFGFVFNSFLKDFLAEPNDFQMRERLFSFLEEMAQCNDFRVKRILMIDIFGALSIQELAVAKKYMGPATGECSQNMWNREALKERMRKEGITLMCWGYGKETVRELEWKLNVVFDATTRSFIEEIGNIMLRGTGHAYSFLNQEGVCIVTSDSVESAKLLTHKFGQDNDVLRKNRDKDKILEIMRFAGLYYILHKDGFVAAYNDFFSDHAVEKYISLAHLLEDLIKNMHVSAALEESYRTVTKQKTKSLIRRNRPKLTLRQKDAFLKRIDKQQVRQQEAFDLCYFIQKRLPELPKDLDDWGYAFGWADYAAEHDYFQELFDEVLTPFLIVFLNQDPGDAMVTRHLFDMFERMTENSYFKSKLALTVFDSLNSEQLEVVKEYMRPRTRELLADLEGYFEELSAKK